MSDMAMSERAPIQSGTGPQRRWYREPWPWILMAGPAVVVVAGFVTLWIAVSSFDGMVVDDYYKQGLAINRTLERDRVAARLGLQAEAVLAQDHSRVRVAVSGEGLRDVERLRLRAVHPARSELDQSIVLQRIGDRYEGNLEPLGAGRWTVSLEDEAKTWRLVGQWQLPRESAVRLEVAGESRQRN